MILIWLVAIPLLGGIVAWYSGRVNAALPRWISLIALTFDFVLVVALWFQPGIVLSPAAGLVQGSMPWIAEMNWSWIPQLGISFHLAMDGLSLLLVLLTVFLGVAAVVSSWTEVRDRVGFFHLNLMWVLTGIIGVFIALDLFIFYFFWELMLIPMYFLIALWGHEKRFYAAIKFFIFTQVSGLLMLIAILGLYFIHARNTGVYTFDYMQLLGTSMGPAAEFWLMMGFLVAFAVKLPAVPVHTWLPDAHTEAPTAGSVILAGLLLKTGAYGLLRFTIPLFPRASFEFAPVAFVLAVIGILYGAVLAFAQTDLKRLVAYTSISHMGFVLLGIFVWNEIALQGAVMQMMCHGVATGALFMLVGALQERVHTREMGLMGGLWATVPRMGAVALFLALAALGLPGLGNFIGEFLVLLGAFRVDAVAASAAALGLVAATVYSLWMIQRAFQGAETSRRSIPDFGMREMTVMAAMIVVLLWLGLYPQPVFNKAGQALDNLKKSVNAVEIASRRGQSLFYDFVRK